VLDANVLITTWMHQFLAFKLREYMQILPADRHLALLVSLGPGNFFNIIAII
jgi:hypothetical protein